MRNCPYCNNQISELASICPYCRNSIYGTPPPPPPSDPGHPVYPSGGYQPPTRKKRGTPAWVYAVVSFVVVLGIGLAVVYIVKNMQTPPKTQVIVVQPTQADTRSTSKGMSASAATSEPAQKTASQGSKITYSLTGNLTQNGRSFPIVMELRLGSDGNVTGRYAYASTLRSNGNKASSWFSLSGTHFTTRSGLEVVDVKSRMYGQAANFEELMMWIDPDSRDVTGQLRNCATGDEFEIELRR